MLACYFRNLFKNTKDGIIQLGCIRDCVKNTQIDYIYTAGSYSQRIGGETERAAASVREAYSKDGLEFYVLGAYTINYICKFLDLLSKCYVRTVILPYLAPIQRLLLAEKIPANIKERKDLIAFLEEPYAYLREQNVGQVFFLYENGTAISKEPEELEEGYKFEPVEEKVKKLVTEMEGYEIPLVKAGYMILEQWIFYLGVYGPDMREISQFVRGELYDSNRKREELFTDINRTSKEFQEKFGEHPYATIAMYQGPVSARPSEKNSLLTAKVFQREQKCIERALCNGTDCTMRCQHEHDYDVMQYHKNKEKDEDRFGVLLLGNVSLQKYFSEVTMRFWKFREKIRAVTLPDCGVEQYWNAQALQLIRGKDVRYWLCPIRNDTSTRALLQIITESSFNRLIQLNHEYGFCMAGYLVPVEYGQRLSQ